MQRAKKEARLQEKELIKAFEKTNQSTEREKKKLERELQKEKLRNVCHFHVECQILLFVSLITFNTIYTKSRK